MSAETRYWETRCRYCEAPLRRDGGCCMWYGEPHDLPYRERPENESASSAATGENG